MKPQKRCLQLWERRQDDEQKKKVEKKLFDYPAAMRCHNFADCPPCPCPCPCPYRCPWPGVLRPCHFPFAQQHDNCHISKSLLTSGLWLQQLMESFPLARLAHSFGSANQLAVPADHSIKSSFHFVLASLYFSPLFSHFFCLPLQLWSQHTALRLR